MDKFYKIAKKNIRNIYRGLRPFNKPNKRIAIIDVRRGSLFRLASELQVFDVTPVMWLGYAEASGNVNKRFPKCEFYDYWRFNRGLSLEINGLDSAPSSKLLTSKEFLVLKDKVIKMMDRQDAIGRFRRVEREALFYSLFFFFFSKVKEKKIDLVISAHSPHLPATMVMYGVCQLLGIKTVHARESAFVPFTYLATDFFGENLLAVPSRKIDQRLGSYLSAYVDSFGSSSYDELTPLYMKNQAKMEGVGNYEAGSEASAVSSGGVWKHGGSDFSRPPGDKVSYKIKHVDFLSDEPSLDFFATDELSFKKAVHQCQVSEANKAVSLYDAKKEFVYFPLHYEPEKTSNPDGGDYYDSYCAIASLRAFLPNNIYIYIKEHPSQINYGMSGYLGRSPYFYKCISALPNVVFVDISIPSFELIKRSKFTVSQTGTACLEAACMGSKAVLMGDVWFGGCANIYKFDKLVDYRQIVDMPVAGPEIVKKSLLSWVDRYAIHGCVTGSFIRYFQEKYPDENFYDPVRTVTEMVSILKYNKLI